MTQDAQFAGSIPAIYEECLVPVLFEPFAIEMVEQAVALAPGAVLELAAGTGVVSNMLAAALPETNIIATDLNRAMLEVPVARGHAPNVAFATADAQELWLADGLFDLVLAQFGVMFFADKVRAYREVRRVLKPGGTFIFSVWGPLENNTGSAAIHHAVRAAVPEPKPEFIARTPFGYHDFEEIMQHVGIVGFREGLIMDVKRTSPPGSAERLARGMCLGSPLANELAVHPEAVREQALAAAIAAAQRVEDMDGGLKMHAMVLTAR